MRKRQDTLTEQDAAYVHIRSIIATSQRSAFHVLDLTKVVDLFRVWCRTLPDVRPHYAVKCNPHPALLSVLAKHGAGFDRASRAEMEAVLALGVRPGSIIYDNPCKLEAHLMYAAKVGINLTTYDSEDEVPKIKRCHPNCDLLIRLKGPDGGEAKVDLGTKYVAHASEVVPLLRAASRAGLNVVGVSFHVGTGATNPDVYRGAIEAARAAFDAATTQLGMPPMRILDIGGGFIAGAMFDEAAMVIKTAIAHHFGDLPQVEVIGEPGRYFAETAFTLATRVIGKRTRGEVREYWIDDGIYGSLNCINMDHYVPRPKPLARTRTARKTYMSTVFGPTCDSLDTVVTGYELPEITVGDWLISENMGAYSTAAGSNFNGFSMSDIKTYVAYTPADCCY